MTTLNDFKNQFKSGFVHPNLFRVQFTGNKVVDKYSSELSYACKSINIPGVTFTEAKFFREGYYDKYVSGADFDTFPCTFLIDAGNRSKIISCFDEWSALIFNNGKFGFKKDYQCNISINLLNTDGTVLYESNLIGVFPTNLTPFELSSDSSDTIMEYLIDFQFLKFK